MSSPTPSSSSAEDIPYRNASPSHSSSHNAGSAHNPSNLHIYPALAIRTINHASSDLNHTLHPSNISSSAPKEMDSVPRTRQYATAADWRHDDSDDDQTYLKPGGQRPLYPFSGIVPAHRATEYVLDQIGLEIGVKLTWTIDESSEENSSMFAMSEVDDFLKVKRAVADQLVLLDLSAQHCHVDKLVVLFTEKEDEETRKKTETRQTKIKKTETNYSPVTFNILMRAIKARLSVMTDYCACDDNGGCEGVKKCPEVYLILALLDEENQRSHAEAKIVSKGKDKKKDNTGSQEVIDPDKIIRPAIDASDANPDSIEHSDRPPKVVMHASCLRRLLENGGKRSPPAPTSAVMRGRSISMQTCQTQDTVEEESDTNIHATRRERRRSSTRSLPFRATPDDTVPRAASPASVASSGVDNLPASDADSTFDPDVDMDVDEDRDSAASVSTTSKASVIEISDDDDDNEEEDYEEGVASSSSPEISEWVPARLHR